MDQQKMFTRILVPLDGSPIAEKALPHARALARTLKIPVTLLTAIETASGLSGNRSGHLDSLIAGSMRNAKQYLEKISKTFGDAAPVEYKVEKSAAAAGIIMHAAPGTLITMASHGHSGLARWLLGSVTDKIVRGVDHPVLVVRADDRISSEGEAALDSILVPLDGSTQAESVLTHVVELAKAFDAKVAVLRAYSLKQVLFNFAELHPDLDEVKSAFRWEATSYAENKCAEVKARGVREAFYSVVEGDAAETIIEMGKRTPTALIVMSAHSGSTARKWVLGSVTEKVLRHSKNPVLAIRA
jgi:nucleotide-binding universal stress UspA family protein